MKRAIFIISIILIVDQLLKIYFKIHFQFQETKAIIPGFIQFNFTENMGMSFNYSFQNKLGKLFLSLLRITIFIGLVSWLIYQIKNKGNVKIITATSFLLAGTMGNLMDNLFYGKLFSTTCGHPYSYHHTCDPVAKFMQGGYGNWGNGMVVDFFQFTLRWPDFIPTVGNKPIMGAIFNVADVSIFIGLIILIFSYKKIFKDK